MFLREDARTRRVLGAHRRGTSWRARDSRLTALRATKSRAQRTHRRIAESALDEVPGDPLSQKAHAPAQLVHADRHRRAFTVLDADPPGEAGLREPREDPGV